MLMTIMDTKDDTTNYEGLVLGVEPSELAEKLEAAERPEYRGLLGGRAKGMPVLDKRKIEHLSLPEGWIIRPVVEVLYEAGDPEGTVTVRLYVGLSERGGARMLNAWCHMAELWQKCKRRERKATWRLFPWTLPDERAGDKLFLVGAVAIPEDQDGTPDLKGLIWAPAPGLGKDDPMDWTTAVFRAVHGVVTRTEAEFAVKQ